jgi:hypothetical protein
MKGYWNWGGSIALLCFAVVLSGGIDRATRDALKVRHLLATIEKHASASNRGDQSAEVTEKELNAYIAYRLAQDKQSMVDGLTVNLLDNNRVRGSMRLDAQHLSLGPLFGDELDFDFKGNVRTRNGAGRLDLASLRLNGYPVRPQVLDMVLGAAAKYYRTEIGGIDDWYRLPKGIKRVAVRQGKAVLYY